MNIFADTHTRARAQVNTYLSAFKHSLPTQLANTHTTHTLAQHAFTSLQTMVRITRNVKTLLIQFLSQAVTLSRLFRKD